MKSAIHEMARVVKPGGRVLIGDEGVAPWLKETEYGKAVICNNKLWASEIPLALLPTNASDVQVSWVLGNCFYVIDFEIAKELPYINMDIEHKGLRGGSMRKRYFGQIEGIDPKLKELVIKAATREGVSISSWIEKNIANALKVSNDAGQKS
jgi:SAM-dependent methyltransferase